MPLLPRSTLLPTFAILLNSRRFPQNICNGYGYPTEDTKVLLFWTPGPVKFWTCIYSDVESSLSLTSHVSRLWLSNIPWYFYICLYGKYHKFISFSKTTQWFWWNVAAIKLLWSTIYVIIFRLSFLRSGSRMGNIGRRNVHCWFVVCLNITIFSFFKEIMLKYDRENR